MDKKGIIIDVNETVIELSGYKKEDLLGKNIRPLAYMLSVKSMTIIIRKFLKRMAGFRVLPYEVEMIKKNGEEAVKHGSPAETSSYYYGYPDAENRWADYMLYDEK
jgi:PAS domain S-box-containing protein